MLNQLIKWKSLYLWLLLAISLLIISTGFLPALKTNDEGNLISGFEAIFGGYNDYFDSQGSFSFVIFIGFFMPLLMTIGLVVCHKKNLHKGIFLVFLLGVFVSFLLSLIFISNIGEYIGGELGQTIELTKNPFVIALTTAFGGEPTVVSNALGAILGLLLALFGLLVSLIYGLVYVKEEILTQKQLN